MLIPYAAGALLFSGLAILIGAAILVGMLDPKARAERAAKAELARLKERNDRIVRIFAERAGRYEPTVIEGEFTVVQDLRNRGAL